MSGTLVMKFGGSTVGTPAALTQVLSIVLHETKHWDTLVIVASALDGVTDALLEAAHLAQLSNRRGYRRIAATMRTRHMALIDQLPLGSIEKNALQADIDRLLFDMLDLCQTVADTPTDSLLPEPSDGIISVGERLSARIIAALLRQNNLRGVAIDATDLIITDTNFGNARPLPEETQQRLESHLIPMLNRKIIPVITGFIGSTQDGRITTLGRGGSDYTASIITMGTGASELWVWADVDGMMSTDPHEIQDARVIPELSYTEVAELAYFGARILHSRMIRPLQTENIPLRIKNIFKPQQPGTRIGHLPRQEKPGIKAVTSIQGIALTAERSGSLTDIARVVDETLLKNIGTHADVMISSQSSSRSFLCFVIPTSAGVDIAEMIRNRLEEKLQESPENAEWDVYPTGIITAIGDQLGDHSELTAQILQALSGIPIMGLAQGPSRCSLSIVIATEDTEEALRRVHNLTIKND